MPDKNWLFLLQTYKFLFNLSNSSIASISPLYALTTLWPEYTSSIWAFKLPSSTCLCIKYFWLLDSIIDINIKPNKLDIIAVKAICQLVTNIIIILPINSVIELTNEAIVLFIVWATVSISLVTRDNTSPVSWLSKYLKGNLLIFLLISRLNL